MGTFKYKQENMHAVLVCDKEDKTFAKFDILEDNNQVVRWNSRKNNGPGLSVQQ